MVPFHASQMFAGNVTAFLKLLAPKGELALNLEDEILRETLVVHKNEVVHPRVAELLGVGQVSNLRAD
jgi:NAD(P) transhydrogenase subunit alpha